MRVLPMGETLSRALTFSAPLYAIVSQTASDQARLVVRYGIGIASQTHQGSIVSERVFLAIHFPMEARMATIKSEDVDQCDRESAAFLAHFMEFATEQFGPRCPDYELGCPCCDFWKLYDDTAKALDFSNSGRPAAIVGGFFAT